MLIFGVCRLDQLRARRLDSQRGRRRFVAATLYPEICDSSLPEKDRLLELVLCQFANANRTYKRTYGNRFHQFDQAIARFLTHARTGPTVRVHDVAVSNGITAVELYRLLKQSVSGTTDYLASDFSIGVVAVRDGHTTLVLDPVNHTQLQLIRPPFVFNLRKRENAWRFPINWLIRHRLEQRTVPDLMQRYLAGDPRLHVERIELLHPDCRQLAQSAASFSVRRVDIMQPIDAQFDLVRAMNILNLGYFRPEEIYRAVAHIHTSLVPGGLFATGSNQESGSPVDGAIYRKTPAGFQRLYQSGRGSSVETHILADHRRPVAVA